MNNKKDKPYNFLTIIIMTKQNMSNDVNRLKVLNNAKKYWNNPTDVKVNKNKRHITVLGVME